MKRDVDAADYFLVFIVASALFHFLFPIRQVVPSLFGYFGILLFVLGWIPNIFIGIYFKKFGIPIQKEVSKKLVTSGFFKFSRNPTYLGMVIALLGEAIFLGSIISFIFPILFAISLKRFNIIPEEKILKRKFGKKYLTYKNEVRRWI